MRRGTDLIGNQLRVSGSLGCVVDLVIPLLGAGETQASHVGLHLGTVVVLEAVTRARAQPGRLFLLAQDPDRVEASVRALLAGKHGPAQLPVILQGCGTLGVGCANQLGHSARHRLVLGRLHHLAAADLDPLLRLLTVLVVALALQTNLPHVHQFIF